MIVLDASVVVELLTNGALADSLRHDLAQGSDSFIVPHLLDVEVASALRRLVGLRALPAGRYSHVPYSGRSFARLVGQAVLPAAAFQAASTGTWHAGRTSRGEQI